MYTKSTLPFLYLKFIGMSISQRSDHLKAHNLCFNCLAPGHRTAECRSLSRCRSCQGKHHTMVHQDTVTTTAPPPPTAASHVATPSLLPSLKPSLTMISQVLLKGPTGRTLICRALLDSGSTNTLISTKVANSLQSLQLPKTRAHMTISGIQGSTSEPSLYRVPVTMAPVRHPEQQYHITAATVSKVTCDYLCREPQQYVTYLTSRIWT